jgi:protein-disulfide isomerase
MKKIYFTIVLVVGLIGIWALLPNASDTNNVTPETDKNIQEALVESDLVIGDKNASTAVIEYADFKCPSCGQFHQTTSKDLSREYFDTKKAKLAFRPMAVIGPDSERAAVGAYCADDQGKFQTYHDAVFNYMWTNYYKNRNYDAEFQDVLTLGVLSSIASDVGIEGLSFSSCMNSGKKEQLIASNQSLASQAGARGTPTFSIGGQLIVGPQPLGVFKKLIEAQL